MGGKAGKLFKKFSPPSPTPPSALSKLFSFWGVNDGMGKRLFPSGIRPLSSGPTRLRPIARQLPTRGMDAGLA